MIDLKVRQIDAILRVFQKWQYLAVLVVSALLYFSIFQYLVASSNFGIVPLTVPIYLLYLLVATASIQVALSIYLVAQTATRIRIVRETSRGILGTLSVIVGGLSAGCSCQAPVLYSLLYFLGFNSLEASSFVVMFAKFQIEIFVAIILINLVFIYHSLSRI